jgi:hypothetical protein
MNIFENFQQIFVQYVRYDPRRKFEADQHSNGKAILQMSLEDIQ